MNFDRNAVRVFRFVRCGFDAATGVAELVYAFDDGPELVETVTVPGAPFAPDPARAAAVERALAEFPALDQSRLAHLVEAALADREKKRPPKHARELFRYLRDTLTH